MATLGAGAAAALAGCSGSSMNPLAADDSERVPTLSVAGWGEGVERQIVEEILRNYDQPNENVEVVYQSIPNDQYPNTLKTRFAGGTEPDVFYLAAERCAQYIENGALLDLAPYLEDTDNHGTDAFIDNLLEPFRYQGGIYGIPKDFTSVGLYYNAAHLEGAGVGRPPETWDEMRSTFERVKARTDVEYPLGFADQPRQTLFPLVFQNGGAVLNEDETRCVIGSNEAIGALQFIVDLHDDGLAGAYSDEISASWEGPALGEGAATAAMSGAWVVPTLQEEYAETYESIEMTERLPIPRGGQQATILLTTAWAASGRSTSEQAAAELIQSLTSEDGMWEWTKTGIALPSRRSLLNKPYYDDQPILDKLGQFVDSGKPFSFGMHHERIVNTILSEVEGALAGVKSADSALKSAQRLINNNVI